ncbi:DUF5995 family protein [soil metagenome]
MPHPFGSEYTSVAEVAAALERVEADCLSRRDRRGVFATAYLQITRAIERELALGSFQDAAWTAHYLVAFGNLYRNAALAFDSGDMSNVPKAWRLAFQAARDGEGLVIQHLVLGINAHINHDLALALLVAGIDPGRSMRYADHTRVNSILERTTEDLKHQVSSLHAPLLQRIDWIAGRLDDDLTRFSIPKAREHAWTFAVMLSGVRDPGERALMNRALDEQAAVLARLVLSRPTRHPILLSAVRTAGRADAFARRIVGVVRRR